MAEKTMISKTLVKEIKKTKTSPFTTRRIRLAINDINSSTIDALHKSGKVMKMNLPKANNVYIYRAGVCESIVFSVKGQDKIITMLLQQVNE